MDFKEQLEKTWKIFTEFLPAMVISTLGLIGISIITLGLLAPVATAGYMQSLLMAVRDKRKPEIGDLFSQMRLFLPLLGFSIIVVIALIIGFAMLVLPGIIMALALTFFCIYMLPLMTDQEMGLVEAVKESSRLAMEEPIAEHIVAIALYIGITAIGQSIILGTLFTQPFATIFILSVYLFKTKEESPEPEENEEIVSTPSPEEEELAPETPSVSLSEEKEVGPEEEKND